MRVGMKPSDFNIKSHFYSTIWGNSEKEQIARNIVYISLTKMDDEFLPFSWEEYKKYCEHKVTEQEKWVLDDLAEGKYLFFKNNKYEVNAAFLGAILEFKINKVKESYEDGICPDCSEDILNDVVEGDECSNCGHVFTEEKSLSQN